MNFFQTSLILATVVVSTLAFFEDSHQDPAAEFGGAPMTDDLGAGLAETGKAGVSISLLFLSSIISSDNFVILSTPHIENIRKFVFNVVFKTSTLGER